MTHQELTNRMTSKELTYWLAWSKKNPFGDERADLRSAQICAVLVNLFSKDKKYEVKDFMPQFGKEEITQVDNDTLRKMFEVMFGKKKV